MKRYQNNKVKIISYKLLTLCSMLCTGILIMGIFYPHKASSGPYLDSAHGTSYGVKRSSTGFPTDYTKGNCAHCHEQHAMIGGSEPNPTGGPDKYELFRSLFVDQSSMFCYGCHSAAVESLQSPTFNNFSYSYTRGGNTALTCPSDIKTAFQYEDTSGNSNAINPCPSIPIFGSSAHTLGTIQSFLVSKSGYGFPTQANNTPCSGCHDLHRAQRNYPVSQPSTHDPLTSWELWGDDDNTTERLPVAVKVPPGTSGYMSPYKVGSGSEEDTFPAGTTGRHTRFKTVCRECHDNAPVPSGLVDVSWNNVKHGGVDSSNTQYGGLKAPYSTANNTSYNLDCTDCHEQ